ncbi:hypothetical protein [Synechococcus sp. ROS8604]|uniref:hypothetical protein n=1 Tax=Synechococcus sp. ROS8604 TaxID=1442557 RepID=UPI0016476146|nr:hypothetical protein [Synechococcus sp. ROS8604]
MYATKLMMKHLTVDFNLFVPLNAFLHANKLSESLSCQKTMILKEGLRHENPTQAVERIKQEGLKVPNVAFVVSRHPYDLMKSYYHHLRKRKTIKLRGQDLDNLSGILKVANQSSETEFVCNQLFYGMRDDDLIKYYESSMFSKMITIPIERSGELIPVLLSRYFDTIKASNETKENISIENINDDLEVRKILENKYPKMSAIYHESQHQFKYILPVIS